MATITSWRASANRRLPASQSNLPRPIPLLGHRGSPNSPRRERGFSIRDSNSNRERVTLGYSDLWKAAGFILLGVVTASDAATPPAPKANDYAGIAKLPDFGGVWELVFGPP